MADFRMERMDDGRIRCYADAGKLYIVYIVLGGSGLNIAEVEKGDYWWEGVGEEFCFAGDSYEEAEEYIKNR